MTLNLFKSSSDTIGVMGGGCGGCGGTCSAVGGSCAGGGVGCDRSIGVDCDRSIVKTVRLIVGNNPTPLLNQTTINLMLFKIPFIGFPTVDSLLFT